MSEIFGEHSGDGGCVRHYMVEPNGLVVRRNLPADGTVTQEMEPWWEPVLYLPDGDIGEQILKRLRQVLEWYLERCGVRPDASDSQVKRVYEEQARRMAGHVVAYTPNGRHVRREPNGKVAVQPPNDNYWKVFDDVREAQRWWEEKLARENDYMERYEEDESRGGNEAEESIQDESRPDMR
jgi:hypothetical protein